MKQRSPQSIACSKQADAKGLHGAERRKFRKACMKGSGGMGKQDVD
ncbi:MAG: PsiF family protein [Methylovirgula sp.]